MWRFYIGFLFLSFLIGCQSKNNHVEEVINDHNDIHNIVSLNQFVEKVNHHHKTKIKYVQFGIEGQRGVRTLIFDGEKVHVSHSVDGDFVEEYNCKGITIKTEHKVKKYILSQCTGDFKGDFELLRVSTTDK